MQEFRIGAHQLPNQVFSFTEVLEEDPNTGTYSWVENSFGCEIERVSTAASLEDAKAEIMDLATANGATAVLFREGPVQIDDVIHSVFCIVK